MNPASRVLLSQGFHVPRRNLKRTLLRPLQRCAFSSTPHTHWGASLSFRFAYSNDPAHTPPSNADFPINIIDRQQSLHTLSTLLQQGELDQARRTLTNILESGPMDGDLDIFRQIKVIIAPPDSDSPPMDLIVQLGAASSSRGYVTFARNEILPLLEKFGTVDLASQLERELSEAESSRQTLLKSKDVFEDASDDYSSILSESKPIQASPQDLMLQQLPSVLPDPLLNDSALFEDEEETLREEILTNSLAHVGKTSLGMLHQLLSEGNFQHAHQFLHQMLELGVKIPHDLRYGHIALALLKTPDLPANRSKEFIAWLQHIPSFDASDSRSMAIDIIAEVINILVRSTHQDVKRITRVTLSLTLKGYSEALYDAVQVIVSSLSPTACTNFIRRFEEHESRFCIISGFPETLQASRLAGFQNCVVQTLISCNRFIRANQVLSEMEPSTISGETLRCLYRAKQEYQRISEKHPPQEIPLFREKFIDEPKQFDFGDDLVAGMRHLKAKFARNTHSPNPVTLASFMAHYIATGRTFGLQILVDKAFRCNRTIVASMILAEMLLYRRMKLPDLVIEAFVENFELHDVPEKRVLELYKLSKERSEKDEFAIKRIIVNPNQKGVVSRKMWPTSGHYNLVWEVLVKRTSRREIKKLYNELIQILSNRPRQVDNKRLGAYVRKSQFSSSAFTPFFRPMMAAHGLEAGQKIFNDMLELDIIPELRVYTELAGQLARHGAVDRAFDIVYRLEAGGAFRPHEKDHKLPKPDLPFYISTLRGFIINRNVKAARDLVNHIERTFPDAQGQAYDDALEDLNGLETLGNDWVHPNREVIYSKP